jgi:hypothetical protein
MAFDFPNSPSEGTVFAPTGGPVYVYSGSVWRMQGSGQVVTAEARSRIVNGAMQISQEYGDTGQSIAGTGLYVMDQWYSTSSIAATSSGRAGVGTVSPNGDRALYATVTTGKPSLAASDYLQITQPIEGIRNRDFQWGTANAKQAVLRFWAMSNAAGTYTVAILNQPVTRSFLASFTLAANVWTAFTIVVPGETTGVWAIDSSRWGEVKFSFAAGSTVATGVAGWQSGNVVALTGMTNGTAATNNTLYIGDVGLYLDPNATGVPPPWQMPDEAQELAACQRYYGSTATGFPVWTSAMNTNVFFKTSMRIIPAVSGGGAGFGLPSGGPEFIQCTNAGQGTGSSNFNARM